MCVQERRAWFSLTVIVVAFGLYGIFFAVPALRPGATAAFAVLALISAEGLIGRKAAAGGRIVMDERDQQIGGFAYAASFGILWVVLVAAVMVPFFMLGPNGKITITTTALSNLIFPAMGVLFFVRSLVMIVLYRRQANGSE